VTSPFTPDPQSGRLFSAARTVRTTDVTQAGRLRLDAVARYLQEVAEDDVIDAGLHEPASWLLRRCVLFIHRYPRHGERVMLRTFCSGLGPRWAERTTTLAVGGSDMIQARALWVAISPDGRPATLGPDFRSAYAASTQGRTVTARLFLPAPEKSLPCRPWPLRTCDFDPAGHVNNTIHWAALEDVLAETGWLPASVELEYREPIMPGNEPALAVSRSAVQADVWLMDCSKLLAAARLAPASTDS
jgi:acyl-ACP thioesterase